MTQHCLHLDQQKPRTFNQDAWWNVISSVYNFLCASTALAQALDYKYKHPELYNRYSPNKPTLLTVSSEELQELSETHSKSIMMSCEDISPGLKDKTSTLPSTSTIVETGSLGGNALVEKELISIHEMERNIQEQFERQQESIYYKMAKDNETPVTIGNPIIKTTEQNIMKDTECETIENISDGSCFSLYSNPDSSKTHNSCIDLIEDEKVKAAEKPCINKVGVSFNCNTPEEFPESQTEIKPKSLENSGSNRCLVTWLTASTPYTKQPSSNIVNSPMKSEEMQTTTNRRFNGMLKTQITNQLKHQNVKDIYNVLRKNLEEFVHNKDINNQVKKITKMVTDLKKETTANEQVLSKPKKETIKLQPKKKPVSMEFKADPLETLLSIMPSNLSTKGKFEQTKKGVVVNSSKHRETKNPNNKVSKCETYTMKSTRFPSVVNTVSNIIRKKVSIPKSQGNKSSSRPSSKNEKPKTPIASRPLSRRGTESKDKIQGNKLNARKDNLRISNLVTSRRGKIEKKISF